MAVQPGNPAVPWDSDPGRTLTVRSRVSKLVLREGEGRTEDTRKDGRIHGRSHAGREFMKYPGREGFSYEREENSNHR